MNAGQRPTLKTIARISGLAVTTVSRALGNAPDISEETKKRVRGIAEEIGYVPNRAGVRLRTGKTNVISLVLATEHDTLNMTSSLIASISAGLQGTRYHLVMIPEPANQDSLQSIRYIVETRSADAIIFNRVEPEDERVVYLRSKGFPFATHGRSNWAADHSFFDFDNVAFGKEAVETLARRNRKRVLLLAPPLEQNYARHMVKGATQAAAETGIALTVAHAFTSDDDRVTIRDGVTRYMQEGAGFDALISPSPNSTMISAATVEALGHTIGQDIDILTKETVPFLQFFRPAILAMKEDVQKAGRFLAKAAVHEIESKDGSHMQEIDLPILTDHSFQVLNDAAARG